MIKFSYFVIKVSMIILQCHDHRFCDVISPHVSVFRRSGMRDTGVRFSHILPDLRPQALGLDSGIMHLLGGNWKVAPNQRYTAEGIVVSINVYVTQNAQ